MNAPQFIRVHNKVINLASVAYVEFLESGRSMIFMTGLTQEKQNIPVDADETRKLKAALDGVTPQPAVAHDFAARPPLAGFPR
jgi:bifunctional DNase/RNase